MFSLRLVQGICFTMMYEQTTDLEIQSCSTTATVKTSLVSFLLYSSCAIQCIKICIFLVNIISSGIQKFDEWSSIENVADFEGGLYLCITETFTGSVREWWDMWEWAELCEKLLLSLKTNASSDHGHLLEISVSTNLNLIYTKENLYKFTN